jgi:uncharacterized protein (TIGR02594 family)
MAAKETFPEDPPYLKAAFSKLGLSEISGPKHEKQILEMYAACGHTISDDETAWCAAFVGWCLKQGGHPNTGSLMARSYVKYGTPLPVRGFNIPRGAICIWPRGAPPSGHVNFCLHDDGETLTLIGGNQNNERGGGVTITRESKSKIVAAVLPKPVIVPQPKLPDVEPVPPKPEHWLVRLLKFIFSLFRKKA